MVAHAYKPSTQNAETEGLQVQSQPGPHGGSTLNPPYHQQNLKSNRNSYTLIQ
jgi:hypothetical protein